MSPREIAESWKVFKRTTSKDDWENALHDFIDSLGDVDFIKLFDLVETITDGMKNKLNEE